MIRGHVGLDFRILGLGHAREGPEKRPYSSNIDISGLWIQGGGGSVGSDRPLESQFGTSHILVRVLKRGHIV
jgi:hypothetical protein